MAASVAALVTLLATSRGPGVNVDSTVYLSSGLNLAKGAGLRDFTGEPLTIFPPGLSLVVAFGDWMGIGAEWTVRLFNAAAFATAVFLGFVLLRRHVRSTMLVATSTVALAVSVPLLVTARMAWTEPAFIVVCLALILTQERLIAARRLATWVVLAAGLVWIAFAFRYAGIALIPAGALAIAFGRRDRGIGDLARSAGAFVALASIGPVVWIIRNHTVDGTYMGPRARSSDTFWDPIEALISTLGRWVFPDPASLSLQLLVGLTLLVAATLAWLRVSRAPRDASTPSAANDSLLPMVCFVGTYAVYLIGAQLTTAIDPIGTRLMAPLFVPIVVLGAVTVERLLLTSGQLEARSVRIAAVLLAAIALPQALVFIREARSASQNGVSYTSRPWQSSEVANAARNLPDGADIYSNDHWALWAVLRRQPLRHVPAKGGYRTNSTSPVSTDFIEAVACKPSYLVSFDTGQYYFYSADELSRYVDLSVVSVHSDGTIYRIRTRSTGTACDEPGG